MAGVFFHMDTGEVSLIAATAKTVIEIAAAANHRCLIHEMTVMFKGITVTNEPVTVELTRFAASGTGTAGTPQKLDPDYSEAIQTGFEYNHSVEPASQTVLRTWAIHPQSGIIYPLPINRPEPIPGGDFLGIRCTADDAVTVLVHGLGEE
jgi:hypothetical protein